MYNNNTIASLVEILAKDGIKIEPNTIRDRLKRVYPKGYYKGVAGIIFIHEDVAVELLQYFRLKKKQNDDEEKIKLKRYAIKAPTDYEAHICVNAPNIETALELYKKYGWTNLDINEIYLYPEKNKPSQKEINITGSN